MSAEFNDPAFAELLPSLPQATLAGMALAPAVPEPGGALLLLAGLVAGLPVARRLARRHAG